MSLWRHSQLYSGYAEAEECILQYVARGLKYCRFSRGVEDELNSVTPPPKRNMSCDILLIIGRVLSTECLIRELNDNSIVQGGRRGALYRKRPGRCIMRVYINLSGVRGRLGVQPKPAATSVQLGMILLWNDLRFEFGSVVYCCVEEMKWKQYTPSLE